MAMPFLGAEYTLGNAGHIREQHCSTPFATASASTPGMDAQLTVTHQVLLTHLDHIGTWFPPLLKPEFP